MTTKPNQTRWRSAAVIISGLLSLASPVVAAQWTQTTPLPDGWSSHSLHYWAGYLYQVGGNNNTISACAGTNVFRAKVQNGGSIGTWSNTTSLPEGILNHAGVTANGFLYVLGGIGAHCAPPDVEDLYYTNVVYFAAINTNGSIGDWHPTTPLPYAPQSPAAAVWNNRIYVIGGYTATGFKSTVYSANILPDGSLSSWVLQAPIPLADPGSGVLAPSSVVANGYLYVLGGVVDHGGDVSSSVYYTKINSDGTLAGWNTTSSMPAKKSDFGAVIANGRIFVMGGWDGSGPVNTVYSAAVKGDGSLSNWSAEPLLLRPSYQCAATVTDSHIFVSGGSDFTRLYADVFSLPLPSLSASPVLTSPGWTNQNFQLKLASDTNTGFGFLASTNLTDWTRIGWGFTGTNGTLLFEDTNAASFPSRYYRTFWPLP